ncbi:MAG TPA: DUF2950 family protein, partial [bacterium]|nr:DUF2950 family protein [bacterium]
MGFASNKILSSCMVLGLLVSGRLLLAAEKFSTPEAAQQALIQALSSFDPEPELKKIFGKEAADLWTSGDPSQDKERRQAFLDRVGQQSNWAPLGK